MKRIFPEKVGSVFAQREREPDYHKSISSRQKREREREREREKIFVGVPKCQLFNLTGEKRGWRDRKKGDLIKINC